MKEDYTSRVTVEARFEAAHRIEGLGKCANIHGHNYLVQLTISGPLNSGVVCEFAAVGKILKKIIAPYDHAFVYDAGDAELDALIRMMRDDYAMKLRSMPGPPTAENMAYEIMLEVESCIDDKWRVEDVTIWETSTSKASARRSGWRKPAV